MKKKILSLLLSATLLISATLPMGNTVSAVSADASFEIASMEVNALESPLGIDNLDDFSWTMESNVIGAKQSAYQLLLAKDENFEDVVWDSGKVASNESVGVDYAGAELTPETDYWWKVIVTNEAGQVAESDVAHFSTGLMEALDPVSYTHLDVYQRQLDRGLP